MLNADGFCKFWAQGRCRYGDRCRYPHGDGTGNQGGGNGTGGGGGFGAGGGFGGGNYAQNSGGKYSGQNHNTHQDVPPQWPLTSIGNTEPSEGNLLSDEISPEELRVQAYMAAPRGHSQEVNAREAQLVREHKSKSSRARGECIPIEAGDPFAMGNGASGRNGSMRDMQPNDPFSSGSSAGGAFGLGTTSTAMNFDADANAGGGATFGGQATSTFGNATNSKASPFGVQQQQQQPSSTFSNGFSGAQATPSFGAQQPPSAFGNLNGNGGISASTQPVFGNGSGVPQTFGSNSTSAPAPTFGVGGGAGQLTQTPSLTQAPAPTPAVQSMMEPPKQEVNLGERDLKAFNAQTFGFDPVPETAPPARFC